MRSLVVLGSSVTALAVVRNAHALGLAVALYDTRRDVAAYTRLAAVRIREGATDEESLGALRELSAMMSDCGLVATSDEWLRFLMKHRGGLTASFAAILHPGSDALTVCLEKPEFARWCASHGVPSPEWYDANELAAGRTRAVFPVLLRPARTSHARGGPIPKAVEAVNEDELADWLRRYREADVEPVVTESLLSQGLDQLSVGAARSAGRTMTFVARKVRPLPERCAVGSYVELHPDEEAERIARHALDALDYHGIAEIEILRSGATGRYYVVEINARPWIQYGLAAASGHDLLAFMFDPARASGDRRIVRGKRWIHFGSDLYNCFSRSSGLVRRGELSLRRYAGTLLRANTFAVLNCFDPRPFLVDMKRTIALVMGRPN
jgi:predicted ATP-grasp superfamily ATP-dependent carboligase